MLAITGMAKRSAREMEDADVLLSMRADVEIDRLHRQGGVRQGRRRSRHPGRPGLRPQGPGAGGRKGRAGGRGARRYLPVPRGGPVHHADQRQLRPGGLDRLGAGGRGAARDDQDGSGRQAARGDLPRGTGHLCRRVHLGRRRRPGPGARHKRRSVERRECPLAAAHRPLRSQGRRGLCLSRRRAGLPGRSRRQVPRRGDGRSGPLSTRAT